MASTAKKQKVDKDESIDEAESAALEDIDGIQNEVSCSQSMKQQQKKKEQRQVKKWQLCQNFRTKTVATSFIFLFLTN